MRTTTVQKREISETIVSVTCDYCGGTKADYGGRIRKCSVCEKDICRDHQTFWDRDPFTCSDTGDCPPRVCLECDKAVTETRSLCAALCEEYDNKIDAIEKVFRASRNPSPNPRNDDIKLGG